jgi:hypothetical protein
MTRAICLLLVLLIAFAIPAQSLAARTQTTGHSGTATISASPTAPLTFACWFQTSQAQAQVLVSINATGNSTHFFALYARGDAGRVIQMYTGDGGGTSVGGSNPEAYTSGAWSHACAIETSSTSRTAYCNGVQGYVDTGSRTPASLGEITVGRMGGTADNEHLHGTIAHVAIWRAVLTPAEVYSLSRRAHPYTIRPTALYFYDPCNGHGTSDRDLVGGLTLTAAGTSSQADEPAGLVRQAWGQ